MFILINKSFKAIRTGQFVVASAEAAEFIINTDSCELSNTVLAEVCAANKVVFSKKATKSELLELIEAGVEKLKLPVQNEKPDSLKVREIVDAALAAGKDDEDEILMQIISSGVKIKFAMKLYKQAMVEGGHLVSSRDRADGCRAILVEAGFKPKEWDDVQVMIDRLVEEVPATETSQAYAQIRKYAKEFDLTLPKPEKKMSTGGFRAKIYAWCVANPLAEEKAFYSWIVEKQDKDEKLAAKYWPIFEFAKQVAASTMKAAEAA
jgi:hypothetical protein